MKINSEIKRLEFLEPFGISKLVRSHQDVLRVTISDGQNVGHGETPAIPYYGKKVGEMKKLVDDRVKELAKLNWSSAESWYPAIDKIFSENTFVRGAIDAAAWDLFGQRNKVAIWKHLGLRNPKYSSPSNFTIGLGSPEYVRSQIIKYPWTSYKLKLGSDRDEEVLKSVADVTDRPFRLDANGAWDYLKTKSFLKFCASSLPKGMIEMIEEPYKDLGENGLETLKAESKIPFYADESFQSIEDLKAINKYFHGINIKLDKCGGLTPALDIIKKAKTLGLKIQLGCMSASGISIAPAIQISTLADVVDLDAPLLIHDADFGAYYENGVVQMRGEFGLGIQY